MSKLWQRKIDSYSIELIDYIIIYMSSHYRGFVVFTYMRQPYSSAIMNETRTNHCTVNIATEKKSEYIHTFGYICIYIYIYIYIHTRVPIYLRYIC